MMETKTMPERARTLAHSLLTNLIELTRVKSIVTLCIIFVFSYKALREPGMSNEFVMISTAVITYYFNRKER